MIPTEWQSIQIESIKIVLDALTFISSLIAIYFTYANLKEMRKQLHEQQNQYFEQNRGNLIFYIQKSSTGTSHDLIVKNFGNSPAKLLSLKINPDLDWSKIDRPNISNFNITKLKNIFLAPQQHIETVFNFNDFKESELDVEICYSTCGKEFKEEYKVDINYLRRVLTVEPKIDNELSALKNINKSITNLSNRFI